MTSNYLEGLKNSEAMQTQPFNRVQLFSGGGSRFGYYLGSYAALYEYNQQPDMILATCGGSLAALLVDIAPHPKSLKKLSQSHQLYEVIRACHASLTTKRFTLNLFDSFKHDAKHSSYLAAALKRWVLSHAPKRLHHLHTTQTSDELLAELQQLAMFELDNEALWLNELTDWKDTSFNHKKKSDKKPKPDIAIIASRICDKPYADAYSDVEQNDRPAQLQQVLFTSQSLNQQLTNPLSSLQCPTHAYAPQRLLPDIALVSFDEVDIKQAVRASMADMYYLAPINIKNIGWCLGGVIDLTPIEIASQLGQTVYAETKSGYDRILAVPAIKHVFGFDANIRLRAVHQFSHSNKHPYGNLNKKSATDSSIHWLPFADNSKALAGQHAHKRINLKHGILELVVEDYAGFAKQMQAQWDYGYRRTVQYLNETGLK